MVLRSLTVAVLLCGIGLIGCSSPHQRVVSDAQAFVRQHLGPTIQTTIVEFGPGEGDSDDVYYHVRLLVVAPDIRTIAAGPFAGLDLRPNVPSTIELEMLYQHLGGSWSLTHVTVHRMPGAVRSNPGSGDRAQGTRDKF